MLNRAREMLAAAGVPEPRVDAEWLLAHVLGVRRDRLWTEPDLKVGPAKEAAFRSFVERRCKREPLQYIIGTQEFYGRSFRVTPDVLIPRPETELLVDTALAIADCGLRIVDFPFRTPHSALRNRHSAIRILDVGTGSGCIAITLALELPTAHIVAIDSSGRALEIARQNATTHAVSDRVIFINHDFTIPHSAFDVLISNPPYVPITQWPTLQPEVRDYEPREALVAGEDGLDFIRMIINHAPSYLKPGGWLLMEIGDGQATEVAKLFGASGLYKEVSIKKDYGNIERIISVRFHG